MVDGSKSDCFGTFTYPQSQHERAREGRQIGLISRGDDFKKDGQQLNYRKGDLNSLRNCVVGHATM
jgi:hypothetical protein